MQRTQVLPGTIASVGYEAATATLELGFSSQEVYQYFNVPLRNYIELMNATSKGDYFNHNIKDFFESKKITEDYV